MSLLSRLCTRAFCASKNIRFLSNSSKESNGSSSESDSSSNTRGDENRFGDYQFDSDDELNRLGFDDVEDEFIKEEILEASIDHVNTYGWSMDAISAGASTVSTREGIPLSEAASSLFVEYDLVKYFIRKNNQQLEQYLSSNPVKYRDALEWRLQKVFPYASRYSEAIAIASQPENATRSVQLICKMADSVAHHSMQDKSTDLNWYTKRMALASIYISTELCLVQDKSTEYSETIKFLDRRVQNFENVKNCCGMNDQKNGSIPFPGVISAGYTTLMNILGRNPPR